MEQIQELCPNCGSELVEKKGTNKTTGKPYHFWGCSGYPNCKFIKNTPKQNKLPGTSSVSNEGVMEALRKIYGLIESFRKDFNLFATEMMSKKESPEFLKENDLEDLE